MFGIFPVLTSDPIILAGVAIFAYLMGSIPFGIIVTKLMRLGDLRQIGSGNIGATNVLRTGHKGAAALTLLLDAAKGGIAVLIAHGLTSEDGAEIAALASFIGHLWLLWLGFRGGKGVATFMGALLALAWPVGLASCATWLLIAVCVRISALSAIVAALAAPLWMVLIGDWHATGLTVILACLVIARHHANIARLLAGTEPKIGEK